MRVTGGVFGGRRLRGPTSAGTRPTTDKVREALFAMLGDLSGARVADLYAGTGALGIEALSRGAAQAVFVEAGRAPLQVLRSNLESLALDQGERTRVLATRVERCDSVLARLGPFRLVLCDPPWDQLGSLRHQLARLPWRRWLEPGGELLLELPTRFDAASLALPALEVVRQRAWGDTAIVGWRPRATPEPAEGTSGEGAVGQGPGEG